MNTETQKLLAQLLLQGKLPQDPQVPEWLSGGPYRMLDPVGSPNVYPDADEVRGGYQPSPGMTPQGPSAPPPMMNPNPMAQPSYRPPVDGSVPPLDPDLMRDALRGTYDDASRFDDARAVQTADVGGLSVGPMDVSGDAVAARGVMNDEIGRRNLLSRLDNIVAMLEENPDLLDATATMQGNLKGRILGLKDRFGFELSPEQEAYLGNSAAFRQTVLDNVNSYIKEITGAQVGQGQETQRLMGALPNLGDSPTEFRSKLANAISMARLQVARYNYMRREGTDDRPSDRELTRILRDRGAELYREALDGGLSPSEARFRAAGMLSQEFGI